MIRTETVNLTVINAVAFRQKLTAGGAGVTVLRYDSEQPGIASISKTSGEAIPAKNTPAGLYPLEAFKEAIALTAGMPYKKRGGIRVTQQAVEEVAPEPVEEAAPEEAILESWEYQKIVDAYTDKNGKLSYELLNRDLIRFAHSSSKVRSMLDEQESVEAIRNYIITTKFANITGNKKFSEAQALKAAELLDEVSPKGVFKELNDELRKMSGAAKKKA